ncbi:hypothetical protein Tco_0014498 [Tanacetum coccineum]
MIRSWPNDKKRKSVERDEIWMKAPIVFPPLSMEDTSDEPLIIEAIMEGYLVRRVYVDQGASCFARGVVKLIGKIKLEVVFSDGGLRSLRAFSSTIHSMVKFPTPRGITTLVTWTMIISECRRLEKNQMVEREVNQNSLSEEEGPERVDLTEQTPVNPSYPDQLVTIGGNLSEGCKHQLKEPLRESMDVFA